MQRFTSVYLWAATRQRLGEILGREGLTLNKVLNIGVLSLTDEELAQDAERQRNGDSEPERTREVQR